ncbi:MAG: apolipoprotein N-acyltransferase [bacterium]|nr:apolipoprotein N-acyltransferase [bacterium]
MVWAFLLSLAYYPGIFGFLAWISLVRPFWIISKLSGREAFTASYFYSFFFVLFSLYWIFPVTLPGTMAAITIVAFYYTGVFVAFSALYRFRPWIGIAAAPFLWVGMEYFRTLGEIAFPWSQVGYTQGYYLYILQIVAVIGVHGLSLLILFGNMLVWLAFRKELSAERRLTSAFGAILIVVALLLWGWAEMEAYPTEGKYPVAVLQGSVPLDIKWELENQGYSAKLYDSLSKTITEPVKLVVWPESAVPCYVASNRWCRGMVSSTAKETGTYHLVGALGSGTVETEIRYYNSCYQFNPEGGIEKRYDKVKLVPFSEQVPYQRFFPFMRPAVIFKHLQFLEDMGVEWWSDYHPGDSIHLFTLPDAQYGVLICFESTFPEVTRRMILDGANFIVGITNDTWFGTSIGIHMHSRMFITRAVENRVWMARSANSGLSYVVDPYGRVRESLPVNAVAALVGKVNLLDETSFFTRRGDIAGRIAFVTMLSLLCILVGVWLLSKLRRSSR